MRFTSAEVLEFEDLKRLVSRFVSSPFGAARLAGAAPVSDRDALAGIHADTAEAIAHERAVEKPRPAAHGSAVRVRFGDLPDCSLAVAKLRIEGAVLDGQEILAVLQVLEQAEEIRSALDFSAENFPRLAARAAGIDDLRPLLARLSGKILPDGTMADEASVALGRLRREAERQRQRIQESLERFLRAHREDGVLQEDFVTIRNDRFVVPVVAGQRRRIDGVIHGASGTGHTLFVEPLETIDLNNELVRLAEEEAREVHRILREMTGRLREAAASVAGAVRTLGELDFLFAKARFALAFDCVIPRLSQPGDGRLVLREARHPLLEDVLRRRGTRVVPISFELSGAQRSLLISGPNTGGKTVTLKTAGLLALMAQAGLPVPCAEAELPLFDEVLADIGDNQSIQESLSTFSAHISHIREMVAEAGPASLVLLDELGRATDPEEGGALGVAVLEELRARGALTMASTHLLALKVYGANTPGVLNGSMGFDDESLLPTYRLSLGAPGKSAGLDIAARLGLPASLIERARAAMGRSERDIADFLSRLHARLEEVAALERELAGRNRALAERQEKLAEEWKRREEAKLAELDSRARQAIEEFDSRAGETIGRIEQEAARRKPATAARREVARVKREFREQFQASVLGAADNPPPALPVEEGAVVRLKGVREPGRVRRLLGDGRVEVETGFVRLQVALDDVLEVLPGSSGTARMPERVTLKAGPKAYLSTREINVIGRRAEEACGEVDKFLDDAMLASVDRVRIVHGHGMGILKKVIGELLAGHPHVERFYPATPAEGGAGATIAELKE